MGDYYYLNDPSEETGSLAMPGDEYLQAVISMAERQGADITDKVVLNELFGKKKTKQISKSAMKTNLYIDGTNLFAGQNELFGPKKNLDFLSLIKEIKKIFVVNKIYFYASYIGKVNLKNKKLRDLVEAESRFFNQVKSAKDVYFYKGHRSPTSGKEKGVDVHLAVDIVKHAFQKEYDQAIILTGDADLAYPIEVVKNLGFLTHAIFLPNRFSLAIAYIANTATVLNFLGKFKPRDNNEVPRKLRIIEINENILTKKDRVYKIRGR